jgi:hypothetical protein
LHIFCVFWGVLYFFIWLTIILSGDFIGFINIFLTNRSWRRVERNIEEKREMLKKIFAIAIIVNWELGVGSWKLPNHFKTL